MRKIVSLILSLTMIMTLTVPAFSVYNQPDGDILTDSSIYLVDEGAGVFELSIEPQSRSTSQGSLIHATKVMDGVYESAGKYYVQVTDCRLTAASKVHVDLTDKSNVTATINQHDINDEMADTLIKLSDIAIQHQEQNLETALNEGVDLYLSDSWVTGYGGREYRSEYFGFRNSTPWTTIKSGFNTSVLESVASLIVGFVSSSASTPLTIYTILRDAFYDPTITGGSNKQLQFAGDWGIVLVYTYIKAINYAEGNVGDALLRSIESQTYVNHAQFNVYTPKGNPANVETAKKSVGPITSPDYNSTSGRQKICYDLVSETTVKDNSPTIITVTVDDYSARINATAGMSAA